MSRASAVATCASVTARRSLSSLTASSLSSLLLLRQSLVDYTAAVLDRVRKGALSAAAAVRGACADGLLDQMCLNLEIESLAARGSALAVVLATVFYSPVLLGLA